LLSKNTILALRYRKKMQTAFAMQAHSRPGPQTTAATMHHHHHRSPGCFGAPKSIRSKRATSTFVPYAEAPNTSDAAAADDEEDFESRLAALKRAKGETPYGEGVKRTKPPSSGSKSSSTASTAPSASASSSSAAAASKASRKKQYDYSDETVHFESTPHLGDVAVNVALGITLVWLPLSLASVGRAAFIRYRFTDRRISCVTTAPWKNEQLDAAYQEVKDVVTIGRGIGLWGDMLVTLNDGSKIEMRALPRFMEMKEYILKRRDELTGGKGGGGGGAQRPEAVDAKGFA
jgi:hypothetical protein